jgi:hypothetical protein
VRKGRLTDQLPNVRVEAEDHNRNKTQMTELDSNKLAILRQRRHQTMSNLDTDPADKSQTWSDVFRELDQWEAVETFAERHAQALDTRAGF